MLHNLTLSLFVVVAPSFAFAADDAKEEVKKLSGVWKLSSAEIDGNKYDAEKFGISTIVIADGKLVFNDGSKVVVTYAFKVDPTKKPAAMDCEKDNESAPLPCIYALNGDDLKICMPLLPKKGEGAKVEIKRPESFATKGIPVMTMVLKREKK